MNCIQKCVNYIKKATGELVFPCIRSVRRIAAVQVLDKFKNKINNLIVCNIGYIGLFKTAFFFAKSPNFLKSQLVKELADRFYYPSKLFDGFARYRKSRRHFCKAVNIITHCPQNFLYHTEEKVFHIIGKTLAVGIKSANIVNKNSVNIYLCVFRVKGNISHYRRTADKCTAGNIIKLVALFGCDIAYVVNMGVARKHTGKTGIRKDFPCCFVISLHISAADNVIKR